MAMAIRITFVVVAVSLLSYWHITQTLEQQTIDKLSHYIKERGDKESELFLLAQDNHDTMKTALLNFFDSGATIEDKLDQLLESRADGTWRMKPDYYTGIDDFLGRRLEHHSAYIGRDAPINDPSFRQYIYFTHLMMRRYGPAWTNKFANLYVTYPDNAVLVYWPGYAWGSDADSELVVLENEWGYVADKVHNPSRVSVWTGVYWDQIAEDWLVSAETPVDINDRHVMTIGHDLTLNDLFGRVVNDKLEGSFNFIVQKDGRLIVHPDKIEQLKKANGQLNVNSMEDDGQLQHYYQLLADKEELHSKGSKVFFDAKTDSFLAVTHIKGPDWWFVTVFPRMLLSSAAQSTAEFVLLLGVISLILELVMLYGVLRFKVVQPLEAFVGASNQVKKGHYHQVTSGDVSLPLERRDEVGLLARMLWSMAATIEQNIDDLKHMDRLKDDFMANTSHELRTPLNGIVGIAESMLDGACGELNENQRHNLELIVSSGHRLAHLVDDILDFSKLKHHELNLKCQPVNIHNVTEEVLLFTRHLLKSNRVKLLNQVDNDISLAWADENRVQQILYNLIGNAIKFTNDGMISVSARVWRDMVTVNVSDTGIGIPADKQERIFESFEQADGSSEREYGGTGLGLAVTKRLVELHNGTIKVVSCEGKGSEFSFTLPLCSEKQIHDSRSTQPETVMAEELEDIEIRTQNIASVMVEEPAPTRHETPAIEDDSGVDCLGKILVVDDEAINIQVLNNHLSVSHYTVTAVGSGQEALDLINSGQSFDAVLLDVMMPNMTGYEVCKRIRRLYAANQLPVLMVTAKQGVDEMTACFNAGANDYLTKPVSKSELLQRLKTHVGVVRLNKELSEAHDLLKVHASQLEEKVKLKAQLLAEQDDELKEASEELQNVTLKATKSDEDIQTLEELGRGLTATLELSQVVKNVYRSVNKVMDAQCFMLGILDAKQEIIHVPLIVENNQKLASFEYALDEENRPAVWCVKEKKELTIFTEADVDKYFSGPMSRPKQGEAYRTVVYLPLIIGSKVVGCLSVQHPEEYAYTNEQIEMLRTLAGYSAIAIANASGFAKLEQALQALKETQKQMVLQEKMASLGTLTAGVAHEINNPTNFVHVGAQNLQADLTRFEQFILDLAGDDADEEVLDTLRSHFEPLNDHINTMINGTQRIKTIVQDLRSFTHLHSTDKKPADIIDCVNSTISLVKTQYQEVTNFVTEYKTLPQLECYPAQLNQVFMNIIVNACDAIEEKQAQLGSDFQGQITINCEFIDGHIIVKMADNGCGMDEQTRLKLYEPFYTTKPVGVGTGLGMAISFGIIEDHGGTITATSVKGEGTEITVSLPLV